MTDILFTRDEEIKDVSMSRPHVVILGAGASLAAFPTGDANGDPLPLMGNLADTLGLSDDLKSVGLGHLCHDFEEAYNEVCNRPSLVQLRKQIEERAVLYFRFLRMPETPTLYDYLVLSLREKDVIATFNWDPFLWQACTRNHKAAKPPRVFFLHGCATIGFCEKDKRQGMLYLRCPVCHEPFQPTRILFPIKQKDYVSDPYISSQWSSLKGALQNAFLFTVFGYGAPATDVAAVDLMGDAWGPSSSRSLEQIELIDIADEATLRQRWQRFIHSHHVETKASFYGSLLSTHPRRTCEALWRSLMEGKFREGNPIPRFDTLDELHSWLRPLLESEIAAT
jgi:hypothetical protein